MTPAGGTLSADTRQVVVSQLAKALAAAWLKSRDEHIEAMTVPVLVNIGSRAVR